MKNGEGEMNYLNYFSHDGYGDLKVLALICRFQLRTLCSGEFFEVGGSECYFELGAREDTPELGSVSIKMKKFLI